MSTKRKPIMQVVVKGTALLGRAKVVSECSSSAQIAIPIKRTCTAVVQDAGVWRDKPWLSLESVGNLGTSHVATQVVFPHWSGWQVFIAMSMRDEVRVCLVPGGGGI